MTLFGGLVEMPISLPILQVMAVSFIVGILGGLMGLVLGSFRLAMMVSLIQDPLRLASTNMLINTLVGGANTFEFWRQKRVLYRDYFLLGGFTWSGAIAGSLTSQFLPQKLLFFILGTMLCLSGLMMILSIVQKQRRKGAQVESELAATAEEPVLTRRQLFWRYWITGIYSLVTAYFASTVGLILSESRLPVMIHWLRMRPHLAAGTNMAISFTAGILATLGYIAVGNYDLMLIASVGSVSVIGTFIGAHVSAKVPDLWLRSLIAATVIVVGYTLIGRAV